jgi:hypothetical protein
MPLEAALMAPEVTVAVPAEVLVLAVAAEQGRLLQAREDSLAAVAQLASQ